MVNLQEMADLAERSFEAIRVRNIKEITDEIPRLIKEASENGVRSINVWRFTDPFDFDCPFWHVFLSILGKHDNGECLAKNSLAKGVFEYCKREGLRPSVRSYYNGAECEPSSSIDIYW